MVDESVHVKNLLVDYLSQSKTLSNIPHSIQEFLREHFTVDEIKGIVTQEGFIEGVKVAVPKVWDVIMQSIGVLSSILSMTMVALYTLFILLDYEKISGGWPNLLPESYRPFAIQLMADVEEV
jgi:predicted PurR-regulated permease PerM